MQEWLNFGKFFSWIQVPATLFALRDGDFSLLSSWEKGLAM